MLCASNSRPCARDLAVAMGQELANSEENMSWPSWDHSSLRCCNVGIAIITPPTIKYAIFPKRNNKTPRNKVRQFFWGNHFFWSIFWGRLFFGVTNFLGVTNFWGKQFLGVTNFWSIPNWKPYRQIEKINLTKGAALKPPSIKINCSLNKVSPSDVPWISWWNCFSQLLSYLKPFDLEDEQRLTLSNQSIKTCLQETVESKNLLTSQLINPQLKTLSTN